MVKKRIKKDIFNFKKRWDWWLVIIFLIGRLLLNVSVEPLFMFFFVAYLILIIMQVTDYPFFTNVFILFLVADSMIGTYLFTLNNNFGIEFFGTMLLNFFFIALVVQNLNNSFKN